jgi:hypothetical protein
VSDVSPKVSAAAVAAALATVVWTFVASLAPDAFTEPAI